MTHRSLLLALIVAQAPASDVDMPRGGKAESVMFKAWNRRYLLPLTLGVGRHQSVTAAPPHRWARKAEEAMYVIRGARQLGRLGPRAAGVPSGTRGTESMEPAVAFWRGRTMTDLEGGSA